MKQKITTQICVWIKVFQSVLLMLFFTLLPTLTGLFVAFLSQGPRVKEFLKTCYLSGEFLLYSGAIISSSYLIFDILNKRNAFKTVVPIIIISLLYTILLVFNDVRKEPDNEILFIVSVLAIIYSFGLSIYTQYLQTKKAPDIRLLRDEEQKSIENALN